MTPDRALPNRALAAKTSLRKAVRADVPAIEAMHFLSVQALGAADYSPAEIEAFLGYLGTYDPTLIDDGSYYVIELQGQVIASGGWSERLPHPSESDAERLRQQFSLSPNSAKIRSIFVHPRYARLGLGSRIVEFVESEAMAAGHRLLELWATLTGVPLYRKLGYQELGSLFIPADNGTELPAVHMAKLVGPGARRASAA